MDRERAKAYIEENPLGDTTLRNNKEYFLNKVETAEYFHFCKECGMLEFANYMNEEDLKGRELCFGCNLWIERSQSIGKQTLIVERQGKLQMLTDGGRSSDRKSFLGFGGCEWEYYKVDNPDDIIYTNNMWFGGDIPERLHHLFTVNAVIL